jgi:hypothetical protein
VAERFSSCLTRKHRRGCRSIIRPHGMRSIRYRHSDLVTGKDQPMPTSFQRGRLGQTHENRQQSCTAAWLVGLGRTAEHRNLDFAAMGKYRAPEVLWHAGDMADSSEQQTGLTFGRRHPGKLQQIGILPNIAAECLVAGCPSALKRDPRSASKKDPSDVVWAGLSR